MQSDLEKIFGELAKKLPENTNRDRPVIFSDKDFLSLPYQLSTNQLVIGKTVHSYSICFESNWISEYHADQLLFWASKRIYQSLGLVIFAVLLNNEVSQVEIKLTHPASQIKNLIVSHANPELKHLSNHPTKVTELVYRPAKLSRHPWSNKRLSQANLPCLYLAHQDNLNQNGDNSETVIGFGSQKGATRFAELLLNFGMPQNETVEVELEGEYGFRGVGKYSAEISLNLPGSLGWQNFEPKIDNA